VEKLFPLVAVPVERTRPSRKKRRKRPDNRNKTQTARSLFFRCCYRLRKHADRIQARAVRRCGELLKRFDGRGVNQYTKDDDAAVITQKQAADDAGLSERKHADRIQARAVRRCGELLKQFDGRGVNQYTKDDEGTLITQKQAASDAGLSDHQRVTAVRVANVPEPDFDAGISR